MLPNKVLTVVFSYSMHKFTAGRTPYRDNQKFENYLSISF